MKKIRKNHVFSKNYKVFLIPFFERKKEKNKYPKYSFRLKKNHTFGKHLVLLYVCDSGVPILYHESESIPWVLSIPWIHVYTMSPLLYQESMSIPRVHVYTIRPCLYHESMSIPWILVNFMHPCVTSRDLALGNFS